MMNDSHRKNLELAPKSAPAARRPEETSVAPSDRGSVGSAGQAMSAMVIGIFHELRRRWILAGAVWALAVIPALAYAIFAVPYYTSHGVLQVGSQGNAGMANPLFELTGAGQSQINTEVEVLKRRDFLSRVFKRLKLHVVDPDESSVASLDIDVTIHGASPVRPELTRIRAAIALAEIEPFTANVLPIRIAVEGGEILVQIDPVADDTVHRLAIGQELAHPRASLLFDRLPLDEGQAFTFALVADGLLVESLGASLSVASLGSTREPTNLVRIGFTHADRQLAQSVVQGIMDAYIEQGLSWQVQGATQAATFIRERLAESKEELVTQEEELKAFAEQSHAVQLDTQARVTIENTAEIETQRMKLDLQARVLDNMAEQVRRGATSGNVHLTTSLIEDPILAETVLGLTTAETQLSVLRATLTPEHPRLIELENKVRLQQAHVRRTIDTARKNVISESAELAVKLESASKALASYPEKELHLARLMREVEVRQRLYGFLLEKAQEAEILEASTTTDKRQIDLASLPYVRSRPDRKGVIAAGGIAGLGLALMAVYLARIFQRKVPTVSAVREIVPFPVYGTVPMIADSNEERLRPRDIWKRSHQPAAEAFRSLCVNLSLAPAARGRGRIIQITSSHAGEGKSTINSNLAVSLARSGASVLVVDLDLRKPVQHRNWALRRNPGYSDLVARGGSVEVASEMIQHIDDWGVDVLPAGTRLPDTLGCIMAPVLHDLLDHWTKKYDYVLLDSAPAFVADASILAQHADMVLLVVRPGTVEAGNLRQALETLNRVDVAKGLVFNGVTRSSSDYYYYGYNADYTYGETNDEPSEQDSYPKAG